MRNSESRSDSWGVPRRDSPVQIVECKSASVFPLPAFRLVARDPFRATPASLAGKSWETLGIGRNLSNSESRRD